MAPKSLVFAAGFTCGALLFIAMQSFGQSDEALDRTTETELAQSEVAPIEVPQPSPNGLGQSDLPPDLPALGAGPKDSAAEKREKSWFIPVAATVGMIGVLSLWGNNSSMPCAQYPCAHYAHVGTGVAIGYLFTSYHSPGAAFGAGLAVAVGKEFMDKQDGKSFSRTDIATRLLGTGVGIYFAKSF
jgi:hypothetical protein